MNSQSRSIVITNISSNDAENHQIRITNDYKYLFPAERVGTPVNHNIIVRCNQINHTVVYAIGSHDSRERSGVLRLGKELFKDILGLKEGSKIKISKANNDIYLVQKM